MAAGLVNGMRFFQGMIERTQMSGRPGLKTQTANLKRSGAVTSRNLGRDFVAKVKWAAKYAMAHQKGMTIQHPGGTPYITTKSGTVFLKKDGSYPKSVKFTKPHPIKIPKRLWVFEQFKNRGERIIFRNIQESLGKAIV